MCPTLSQYNHVLLPTTCVQPHHSRHPHHQDLCCLTLGLRLSPKSILHCISYELSCALQDQLDTAVDLEADELYREDQHRDNLKMTWLNADEGILSRNKGIYHQR